jgi:hypothetical protein
MLKLAITKNQFNNRFSMSKIIYVPQGCSARFMKATESYGISGMFTDGFSSCNIVACFGPNKDKLVLMHVDIQTMCSDSQLEQLDEQVKWLGDGAEVIIFYRKKCQEVDGEAVKHDLINFLNSKDICPKVIPVAMEDGGIYISFVEQQVSNVHPNIKIFNINNRPDGLIHHPQEQRCEAIQKITQIIDYEARILTKKTNSKVFSLFDGRAWEPLGQDELEINVSHKITKQDMEYFTKLDPWIVISKKLCNILGNVKKYVTVQESDFSFALGVGSYMEGYINNFNCELLLRRNLKDALNDASYSVPESR